MWSISVCFFGYHFVEHWGVNTIARQLGLHHSTVDRVLAQAGLPKAERSPRQTLTDGYMMSTRGSDSGAHPYTTNSPAPGNHMCDFKVMGFHALPGDEWAENLEHAPPLIVGVNAVPFDENVIFNEGDTLPRRRLSIPAADKRNNVRAFNSREDGVWTVIMVRDRDTGHARDHVLDPDVGRYTFAFSLFERFAGGRWHPVTLSVTFGTVGADVDLQATYNNQLYKASRCPEGRPRQRGASPSRHGLSGRRAHNPEIPESGCGMPVSDS
jgi:hypothetical protein